MENFMKFCTSCKNKKSLEFFSFCKKSKDQLQDKCKDCAKLYMKKRYAETKHIQLEKQKIYHVLNKEKRNISCSLYKKENHKKCLELQQKWKQKNKHKIYESNSLRRASKKNATPNWLSNEQRWMIEQAFDIANIRSKITKLKWHVDHIVPLTSNVVCGLHVPWNLQVIEAKQNLKKYNKFEIL
jgi:hypothetical protein